MFFQGFELYFIEGNSEGVNGYQESGVDQLIKGLGLLKAGKCGII